MGAAESPRKTTRLIKSSLDGRTCGPISTPTHVAPLLIQTSTRCSTRERKLPATIVSCLALLLSTIQATSPSSVAILFPPHSPASGPLTILASYPSFPNPDLHPPTVTQSSALSSSTTIISIISII